MTQVWSIRIRVLLHRMIDSGTDLNFDGVKREILLANTLDEIRKTEELKSPGHQLASTWNPRMEPAQGRWSQGTRLGD